jgi:TPR repeat protein
MSVAAVSTLRRPVWPVLLPPLFIGCLLILTLAPRISGVPALGNAFQGVALLLALWYVALLVRARSRGQQLEVEFTWVRTHWVQALVQGSIYLYWATAWPIIGGQFILIVGQWCFAYACTMLLAWSRRSRSEIGFGPLPIILSTNFFLCFRDEWFALQFAMIALGVFGKELLRWQRDGRSTHIFNPSVLGLSVVSLIVLVTGTTDITWAQQNAIELGRPEHMYLWIFTVGLIVQALFHVTPVTWGAAIAFWVLGTIYTQVTGIYWFLDAGIPIAVFLGMHLLVTDPATSPRSHVARACFGILYGCGVFFLYGLLELLGEPRFYDKLLVVPVLNLLVPLIDRGLNNQRLTELARPLARFAALPSGRQNLAFMMLWIATFATMYATHFVGPGHPGRQQAFWEEACAQRLHNACRNLRDIHGNNCQAGVGSSCLLLAETVDGTGFPTSERPLRALALGQACDLGDQAACPPFADALERGGAESLRKLCDAYDAPSCYTLGTAHLRGLGVAVDPQRAAELYARACERRHPSACSNLAEMSRAGVGTPQDWPRSLALYDRACSLGHVPACLRFAELFEDGVAVQHNAARAFELQRRSCRLSDAAPCGDFWP